MDLTLQGLLIPEHSTLKNALEIIDANAFGIGFVVDVKGCLLGTITDGDIRRALIKDASIKEPVALHYNDNCESLPVNSSDKEIQLKLSSRITHIPLVDENKKIVDFASHFRLRQIPILEPQLNGNELEYVADCVRTNWVSSQGKYVSAFEKKLCEIINTPFCLAVSNGTVALHLALESLGIGNGDEVIVPEITFAATINAVLYTGATPVIVDVDPDTWNISPKAILQHISPKTKAIIPVHLFGVAANMEAILEIAASNKLKVIEDAAQAIGSTFNGKLCGSIGDIGTFSFFGNKTITTGEGGAIVFKNELVYQRARQKRDHGMSKERRYWHETLGFNYRMTNLQAAIGVAQLERFVEIINMKKKVSQWYRNCLSDSKQIQIQNNEFESSNSIWLFSIILKDINSEKERNNLMKELSVRGIDSRPLFYPLGDMPLYSAYRRSDNEASKAISYKGISLPSHVNLTENEVVYICDCLKELI